MATRRNFSAPFKAKVAIEALAGKATLVELSARHQAHPNLIAKWKRQAAEGMVGPEHPRLSIVRQCAVVSIGRSSFHYEARGEPVEPGVDAPDRRAVPDRAGPSRQWRGASARRPGQSVHLPGLHSGPQGRRREDLHRRQRALDGQRHDRAAVALAQVRVRRSPSLRNRFERRGPGSVPGSTITTSRGIIRRWLDRRRPRP